MKSLITGAAGFIGSNLIERLLQEDNEVLGVDLFGKSYTSNSASFGSFKNIANLSCNVLPIDIRTEEFIKLLIDYEPDCIYHLAADSNTLSKNEFEIIKNNTLSFRNIVSYSEKTNCKLVYASSASVYGNNNSEKIFSELNTLTNPENAYAFSKYQMEIMTRNTNAVGLRFFNVYGPNEIFKKSTGSVASQIYQSFLERKEFKLFKNSEKIMRDFIYIEDVIDCCIAASNNGTGIYNVCTGIPRSFQDVYDIISDNVSLAEATYKINPIEKGYQKYTCGSTKKVKELISNFNPNTLEEGIKKMIKNFKI